MLALVEAEVEAEREDEYDLFICYYIKKKQKKNKEETYKANMFSGEPGARSNFVVFFGLPASLPDTIIRQPTLIHSFTEDDLGL